MDLSLPSLHPSTKNLLIINPRCACAARVTVVVCVCVCVCLSVKSHLTIEASVRPDIREVAKFLTAMILAHAQFVLRNMETLGCGPDSAIASSSASATGVSLAVAPPSRMTWRTNSNVSTGVRKTNCACAKIIAVRNFATLNVKLQYTWRTGMVSAK